MDYVNLQQTEYDELQMKLVDIHERVTAAERVVREEIKALVAMEGGFYIEEISNKVRTLLAALEQGPVTQMINVFIASEKGIEAFIEAIKETEGQI